MQGYLALVLHAHLPFVRHPDHEQFLEENWLFEAITETYIPLLQVMERWQRDGMQTRLTLTLTPTLCSMLLDPLLRQRYSRHLDNLIELAEKEVRRTQWQTPFHDLARFYLERFNSIRAFYFARGGDLIAAFREHQDDGRLEIITSAATHGLLPLLADHPPSVRAQILVACDHYRGCFGREPRGIWLPECAYVSNLEAVLREAGLYWFIVDTHGVLNAQPRPRYGVFAPILTTENGIAVFGRDVDSSRQVWSRSEGYPGDSRYRDFYRDAGFDLDFDYLRPHLPPSGRRAFTGLKYFSVTGPSANKNVYDRSAALAAADQHASHFLDARVEQVRKLAGILKRPPIIVAPYDAELFGHWWYEGPEFVDLFVRKACHDQKVFSMISPGDYLRRHPQLQICAPGGSSWGEGGYWGVWLDEKNEWIYSHLDVAQERMTELARRFPDPDPLQARALKQAGRELLLAQASDWPFILRAGTSPDYARSRVKTHLLRFTTLYDQLTNSQLDEAWLGSVEWQDNIFAEIDYLYWR